MSEQATFQFLVTVDVTADPGPWGDRSLEDYAKAAIYGADLRDAGRLDGFGDLTAEASVQGVEVL